MSTMNRIANVNNFYQGDAKRVLCVCSAGLLRSPTAAYALSQKPFDFNTRAAGCVDEYALIRVDDVLLHWAQEIVCMEEIHALSVGHKLAEANLQVPIITLNVPDNFRFKDPELVQMIVQSYSNANDGGG